MFKQSRIYSTFHKQCAFRFRSDKQKKPLFGCEEQHHREFIEKIDGIVIVSPFFVYANLFAHSNIVILI